MASPSDPPNPILQQQLQFHFSERLAEDGGEDLVEGGEGGLGRRTRLRSDQDKAHLIHLYINNFGCYREGQGKFFQYIRELYSQIIKAESPDVKSWMCRQESYRRKEIAEGRSASIFFFVRQPSQAVLILSSKEFQWSSIGG